MTALLTQAGSSLASFLNRLTPSTAGVQERTPIVRAEAPPPTAGQRQGLSRGVIIAIIVLAVLCLIPVCLFLLMPVILTLMGPSIGNVFSEIILTLDVTVTP